MDTGHFQPIDSDQSIFIEQALFERLKTPFRFAVYHQAAYPSYYSFDDPVPTSIRNHWIPSFEKYGLTAVFENHNHAYKKTKPLKAGKIDPGGLIYFGDGSWGTLPRQPKDYWYLDKTFQTNCCFLLELSPNQAKINALNLLGQQIDSQIFSPFSDDQKKIFSQIK